MHCKSSKHAKCPFLLPLPLSDPVLFHCHVRVLPCRAICPYSIMTLFCRHFAPDIMSREESDMIGTARTKKRKTVHENEKKSTPKSILIFLGRILLVLGFDDLVWLGGLAASVGHLFVSLSGCLLRHCGFPSGLGHLALFGCLCLGGCLGSSALSFDLVEVALYDRTCHSADLVHLSNVDGLSGIFAFVVEPVLKDY